ncbi:Homocysteine S-methyltransferase 1 [Hypsizygus marmoreus]|uniref:Homocysteine S-methyltransferase 1 n=1 Tax=Hypsizygus marmoreus TaxID=39966 RepID=A0A369JD22_HYPMA|nr:Homocysteine S-methyltransferase 1 [Hypsizygus marmoreus]
MALFTSSPVILDGGFGTTLEELFELDISQSPLWSAHHIVENPGIIVAAHLAFMRAGAQIVLTSTYQASLSTFRKAGYSDLEAQHTMRKAVQLANDARTSFMKEKANQGEIKIALSLGPFGASLSPAQEFDGFYPPPYGPMGFSDASDNYNSYGDDRESESKSIDALAQFHFDRLLTFAQHTETWKGIDIIAFETVPLVREVKAIRKAMTWLHQQLEAETPPLTPKPWWISFVFPNGKCPETKYAGGPNLTVRDLVGAALEWKDGERTPIPSGIGINCTPPDLIPSLVAEMISAVKECRDDNLLALWLVLYPNGGEVYDIATRTWKPRDKNVSWADFLGAFVNNLSHGGSEIWTGFAIGGCCRTGPNDIRSLKEVLSGHYSTSPSP